MKILLILLVLVAACSTEPTPVNETSNDAGNDSTDDLVEKKVVINEKNQIENSWDFVMREPRSDVLDCQGTKFPDKDWLCTFDYDGIKDVLYFRNSPNECVEGEMSSLPRYESDFYRNFRNSVTRYSAVEYEYGGDEENDSLTFSYGETTIRYYHSSFGFGARKCQPMDCIQAFDKDNEIEVDGCTPDRTVPVVCLPVESGKKYDETSFADNFMKCAGEGEEL